MQSWNRKMRHQVGEAQEKHLMPSQKTVSLCLNTRGLERCVMERCVTQAKTSWQKAHFSVGIVLISSPNAFFWKYFLYLCGVRAAKLLTLGNWCKHHCSRSTAVLAAEFLHLIRIKIYGNSNQSQPDALRRDGTAFWERGEPHRAEPRHWGLPPRGTGGF